MRSIAKPPKARYRSRRGACRPESTGKAVPLEQAVGALGSVNVAVFTGLVAVTAMLSEGAHRPPRRSLFPLPLL